MTSRVIPSLRQGSWVLALFALTTAAAYLQASAGQQSGSSTSNASSSEIAAHRTLLDQYCVTCHNQARTSGSPGVVDDPSALSVQLRHLGLTLDDADVANVAGDPELWESVVRKLRVGAMPPPPRPRPVPVAYDRFRRYLEDELDRAAATRPDPGRTEAFHRLNRTEYGNAVRDLLHLEVDVSAFLPADAPDQNGFDNNAGALSISPSLLERYVATARKISRLAVGAKPHGPVVDTYDIPLNLIQDDQLSEDLPFGSRGGGAIRHNFPVDGKYSVRVRLQTNYVGYVRGIDEAHELEIRLDGRRIAEFTFGGEAPGMPAPLSYAGNVRGDIEWEEYMLHADDGLEIRLPVQAGSRLIAVTFPRETWEDEGVLQPRQVGFALAINEMPDSYPRLGSIEITGPYDITGPGDTPSRQRIFSCYPKRASRAIETDCAREILSRLGRLAYRRSLTSTDIDTLVEFFERGRDGGTFETGIQFALERLLADPDFVFRIERHPIDASPGSTYPLALAELASRLSFFLWSSIPDDALLSRVEDGSLSDPEVLSRQVGRMLADPRSEALVDNFVGQWLFLRNMRSVYPDPHLFPEFDENLREAFERETQLFMRYQLQEDRSVLELLNADYAFVNERLARHYGIPGINGSRFRKIAFTDGRRGGLLGHGSLMTVTSYPNRTSPVLRGKFVLENLVGAPPPEPPPNVPTLEEKRDGRTLTMREAMVQHRENPACRGCHAPMDPIGFSLENYDAIGAWRPSYAGETIDASGALPDGRVFDGPTGLRDLLLSRPDDFVGTVTEKMLIYALGRGLEYYDAPTVRTVVRKAAPEDYRWSAIIMGIVESTPFQMRRSH